MAGRWSRQEGALRDQLRSAEPTLVEGNYDDGDSTVVRFATSGERPSGELGCEVGIQAFLPAPQDERLLPISFRWSVLQMCCFAVWLGQISALVYEADASLCELCPERVRVLASPMGRRFAVRAHRRSPPSHWAGLSAGAYSAKRYLWEAGHDLASGQRVLGRIEGGGASGGPHRHAADARIYDGQKMQMMVRELLLSAKSNRRLVALEKLRQFCGVVVSQTLALPLASFYTRSLYWDMSLAALRAEERGQNQSGAPCAGGAQRRLSRWRSGTPELGSAQRGQTLYRAQRAPGASRLTWQHGSVRELARVRVRLSRQSLRDWFIGVHSLWEKAETCTRLPPTSPCTAMLRTWGAAGR
jgi:hypothetical protein